MGVRKLKLRQEKGACTLSYVVPWNILILTGWFSGSFQSRPRGNFRLQLPGEGLTKSVLLKPCLGQDIEENINTAISVTDFGDSHDFLSSY